MKVPGHVDMTRDAVLLTAADVGAECSAIVAELAATGVNVDVSVYLERRLQALIETLLDDDHQALLELAYQEKLRDWLTSPDIDAARTAARHARLLAPPGAFHDAANGHH